MTDICPYAKDAKDSDRKVGKYCELSKHRFFTERGSKWGYSLCFTYANDYHNCPVYRKAKK